MYALNQEAGLSARPTLEDQIVPRLVQQSCCTALGPRNMKTAAAASVSAMCMLLCASSNMIVPSSLQVQESSS